MLSKEAQGFQAQEHVSRLLDQVIGVIQHHFPDVAVLENESEEAAAHAPYFLVLLKKVSQEQELGRRYYRQHSFELCYCGTEEQGARALHAIAERLYDIMEYVDWDKRQLQGMGLQHEVVEGKLHFYVDYGFHVVREVQEELKMQELKQGGFVHE